MIRRTSTALAAALIGAMVLIADASAQTICTLGQKTCGSRCYSPLKGESCNAGNVICKVGQSVCGTRCYTPAKGETCNIKTK